MTIERIAILGAGAVGASVAHQLLTADPSRRVTVLAEGERAERYRRDGLEVNGETIRPDIAATGDFDLIILATKSYHLEDALGILDRCMGEGTLVMSLLNGIASEDVLGERYGHDCVVPAMILGIDAVRDEEGIRYLNRGTIHFGPNPKASGDTGHAAAGAVADWCESAGLGYAVSDDITLTLWHKYMINVGINQASAVLLAPYGEFQKEGRARDLMMGAIGEVVALSKWEGTGLTEKNIDRWLEVLATLDPTGKTSMLQDAEAGRRTEVDLFAGTVIALAEKHGLEVPVNRDMYRELAKTGS